jgi:hypothetical protein
LPDGESKIFFAGGLDRKMASGATDLPVEAGQECRFFEVDVRFGL